MSVLLIERDVDMIENMKDTCDACDLCKEETKGRVPVRFASRIHNECTCLSAASAKSRSSLKISSLASMIRSWLSYAMLQPKGPPAVRCHSLCCWL